MCSLYIFNIKYMEPIKQKKNNGMETAMLIALTIAAATESDPNTIIESVSTRLQEIREKIEEMILNINTILQELGIDLRVDDLPENVFDTRDVIMSLVIIRTYVLSNKQVIEDRISDLEKYVKLLGNGMNDIFRSRGQDEFLYKEYGRQHRKATKTLKTLREKNEQVDRLIQEIKSLKAVLNNPLIVLKEEDRSS